MARHPYLWRPMTWTLSEPYRTGALTAASLFLGAVFGYLFSRRAIRVQERLRQRVELAEHVYSTVLAELSQWLHLDSDTGTPPMRAGASPVWSAWPRIKRESDFLFQRVPKGTRSRLEDFEHHYTSLLPSRRIVQTLSRAKENEIGKQLAATRGHPEYAGHADIRLTQADGVLGIADLAWLWLNDQSLRQWANSIVSAHNPSAAWEIDITCSNFTPGGTVDAEEMVRNVNQALEADPACIGYKAGMKALRSSASTLAAELRKESAKHVVS